MKPSTFIDKLFERIDFIKMGWRSGAHYEIFVQVIIDDIFRRHFEIPDDEEFWTDTGTGIVLRENLYRPKSRSRADFLTLYCRPNKNNPEELKCTNYVIELKAECRKTNNFGGVNLENAYYTDLGKLKKVKIDPSDSRTRLWLIFIAFSKMQRDALEKSRSVFTVVETRSDADNLAKMTVALLQL